MLNAMAAALEVSWRGSTTKGASLLPSPTFYSNMNLERAKANKIARHKLTKVLWLSWTTEGTSLPPSPPLYLNTNLERAEADETAGRKLTAVEALLPTPRVAACFPVPNKRMARKSNTTTHTKRHTPLQKKNTLEGEPLGLGG